MGECHAHCTMQCMMPAGLWVSDPMSGVFVGAAASLEPGGPPCPEGMLHAHMLGWLAACSMCGFLHQMFHAGALSAHLPLVLSILHAMKRQVPPHTPAWRV